MTPPAEPLRQLPFTPRPFHRETIGSFLTRLASANRIRIWHILQLTAISAREQRGFTPATHDWLGWSPSTSTGSPRSSAGRWPAWPQRSPP